MAGNQNKASVTFASMQNSAVTVRNRKPILAMIAVMALACAVVDRFGDVALGEIAIAGIIFLAWSVTYTTRHYEWLFSVLLLVEVLASAAVIPTDLNTAARYGLEALFCLPVIPAFVRSELWRKGGFRLFLIYLIWALTTVAYSITPLFSLGRVINTSLLFVAMSVCASGIRDSRDLNRLVKAGLIACSFIVGLTALSAVVLPSSQVWNDDIILNDAGHVIWSGAGGMLRFQGFFKTPNELGEVMLTTISLVLLYWRAASRTQKLMLVPLGMLAFGFIALADSRTSAAATLVGVGAFILWKYRLYGFLICTIAMAFAFLALTFAGHGFHGYVDRGDVTTFTGRSEVWAYAVKQIEQSPVIGYGYEVEGAILDKRFPLWYGPWDDGPHSSLHENYLARAVGLGIPAALLWLFIMLRPWVSLFREPGNDPLGLKPIGLIAALPVFVLNFAESSASDCRYTVGLLMVLSWALAEIHRVSIVESKAHTRTEYLSLKPSSPHLSA